MAKKNAIAILIWALGCCACLIAACGGGDSSQALVEYLQANGFQEASALTKPPARQFSKRLGDLTLWVAVPQGPGLERLKAKGRQVAAMIKVDGPKAKAFDANQALFTDPLVARLVEVASQEAITPKALREILERAIAGASAPGNQGAVITSPKSGFSLTVPYADGRIRYIAVVRHD